MDNLRHDLFNLLGDQAELPAFDSVAVLVLPVEYHRAQTDDVAIPSSALSDKVLSFRRRSDVLVHAPVPPHREALQ